MCNGATKEVSAGIAPCNIKCRNLFANVETGLKMNHGRLIPVSDWLTQRSVRRPSETSFTKCCYTVKLLFLSPLRPLRAVAEIESGSTFRETCLATEVQKSFTKLIMLHGATPAETCFAAPLHTSFSSKFQRVTAALYSFFFIGTHSIYSLLVYSRSCRLLMRISPCLFVSSVKFPYMTSSQTACQVNRGH